MPVDGFGLRVLGGLFESAINSAICRMIILTC